MNLNVCDTYIRAILGSYWRDRKYVFSTMRGIEQSKERKKEKGSVLNLQWIWTFANACTEPTEFSAWQTYTSSSSGTTLRIVSTELSLTTTRLPGICPFWGQYYKTFWGCRYPADNACLLCLNLDSKGLAHHWMESKLDCFLPKIYFISNVLVHYITFMQCPIGSSLEAR